MPAEPGIRALLAAYAEGDPDEVLPLGGMLHGLGRRAFRTLDAQGGRGLGFALQVAGELAHPVEILRRDVDVAVIELRSRAKRPENPSDLDMPARFELGSARPNGGSCAAVAQLV